MHELAPYGSLKVVRNELLPPGTIVAMRGTEVLDIITKQSRHLAHHMGISLELPRETDRVALADDLYQQLMELVNDASP